MNKKWYETNGGKVISWLIDNGIGTIKEISNDTELTYRQVENEFKALSGVKGFGHRILFDKTTKTYSFDEETMKMSAYNIWKEMKRYYNRYGSDAKFKNNMNPKNLDTIDQI